MIQKYQTTFQKFTNFVVFHLSEMVKTSSGSLYKFNGCSVFFGSKKYDPHTPLHKAAKPRFINQVHGSKIVSSSSNPAIADGHWTTRRNLSLMIRTADCIPAMIANSTGDFVMALHIGWRGLAQKILSKSIQIMRLKTTPTEPFVLWIGPHIHFENFCLDPNSLNKILVPHELSINAGLKNNWLKKSTFQPKITV